MKKTVVAEKEKRPRILSVACPASSISRKVDDYLTGAAKPEVSYFRLWCTGWRRRYCVQRIDALDPDVMTPRR